MAIETFQDFIKEAKGIKEIEIKTVNSFKFKPKYNKTIFDFYIELFAGGIKFRIPDYYTYSLEGMKHSLNEEEAEKLAAWGKESLERAVKIGEDLAKLGFKITVNGKDIEEIKEKNWR